MWEHVGDRARSAFSGGALQVRASIAGPAVAQCTSMPLCARLATFVGSLAFVLTVASGCSDPVEKRTKPVAPVVPDGGPVLPPPIGDGGPVLPVGACVPQNKPATPTPWQQPHALRRNVCSPQEATSIVKCLFQQQDCQAQVSAACHACSVSSPADPYAGALIVSKQGETPAINVEGCIAALSGDISANGCGPKYVARFECEANACEHCVQDEQAFVACADQADRSVCAAQAAAATCADPYLATCFNGENYLEVAFNLIKIFCGP